MQAKHEAKDDGIAFRGLANWSSSITSTSPKLQARQSWKTPSHKTQHRMLEQHTSNRRVLES